MANQYGADALRMALVVGVAPGSDIALSEDKIRAQRNFVNKIWNASRFVQMLIERLNPSKVSLDIDKSKLTEDDKSILDKLQKIIVSTTKNLNKYHFGQASEDLYHFFWHDFCDVYIESAKDRGEEVIPVLLTVLITSLKLLHPFIPFITETVYQDFKTKYNLSESLLATTSWPHED
jgi:valyl-tRNA synthetase